MYANNKGIKGKSVNSDAKYLPFIPPAHGISELRFDISSKHAHLINGFIKGQVEYYAAQKRAYLEFGTETPTPAYTLFNAGIGGTFTNKTGKPIISLYIMGNNLFDKTYQDHLNRLKYFEDFPGNFTGRDGIFNMGRNFSLKLDIPLDFSKP